MAVRIVDESQVHALLDMRACIELMDATLRTVARGGAVLPLRTILRLPDGCGVLASMPSHLNPPDAIGLKAITVFPGNQGSAFDSHQGVVLLFEAVHGSLVAILDASSITAIRTAAVSGVATRALANANAGDLAILGSGVQAASHLDAMAAVRSLRRVRVFSRDPRNAARFAAAAREVDSDTIAAARLYADRRESLFAEAGDFLIPRSEGRVTDAHLIGELGEVLEGTAPARERPEDLTAFKSLGLAVEDLAAPQYVATLAAERAIGIVLEIGGKRDLALEPQRASRG
ncbi:MAG: ornithine cyclodeaminase family protein [Candidatus Eisenbacteria bacterium]|uniref:Ornithine cyclodeaminase family protein n=1 Tax=Eiseniibacteriota bacterium TaxID=2212470 RepID=A0A849SKJ1_UNCEI|nr:ornithine cyclodeaminase family protein [Candidatus Eisenbacteria bacterium]